MCSILRKVNEKFRLLNGKQKFFHILISWNVNVENRGNGKQMCRRTSVIEDPKLGYRIYIHNDINCSYIKNFEFSDISTACLTRLVDT